MTLNNTCRDDNSQQENVFKRPVNWLMGYTWLTGKKKDTNVIRDLPVCLRACLPATIIGQRTDDDDDDNDDDDDDTFTNIGNQINFQIYDV